jgi:hypothetical protein
MEIAKVRRHTDPTTPFRLGEDRAFTTPELVAYASALDPGELGASFYSAPSTQTHIGEQAAAKHRAIAERMKDPNFRRRVEEARSRQVAQKVDLWQEDMRRDRLEAYKADLADWLGRLLGVSLTAENVIREIGPYACMHAHTSLL